MSICETGPCILQYASSARYLTNRSHARAPTRINPKTNYAWNMQFFSKLLPSAAQRSIRCYNLSNQTAKFTTIYFSSVIWVWHPSVHQSQSLCQTQCCGIHHVGLTVRNKGLNKWQCDSHESQHSAFHPKLHTPLYTWFFANYCCKSFFCFGFYSIRLHLQTEQIHTCRSIRLFS